MKCICLGYYDEKKWEAMSELEWLASLRECLAYDEVLRANGHLVGGEAVQIVRNAKTLRWQKGTVSVADGPFADTPEQLGGILVLKTEDLGQAVRLMSRHPGIRLGGCFEIRPTEEPSLNGQRVPPSAKTTPCNRLSEGKDPAATIRLRERIPAPPVGGSVGAHAVVPSRTSEA